MQEPVTEPANDDDDIPPLVPDEPIQATDVEMSKAEDNVEVCLCMTP